MLCRTSLLAYFLLVFLSNTNAQGWQVASKNGCGIDGYITYLQKDSVNKIGYLANHELRFDSSFIIRDSILQFTMLDEYQQQNSLNNTNNFFILTKQHLYRCTSNRDGGSFDMKLNVQDSIENEFNSAMPLRDGDSLSSAHTILQSTKGDTTLYQLFDWSTDSIISQQEIEGKVKSYYYSSNEKQIAVIISDKNQSWLYFLNSSSLSIDKKLSLPYRFEDPVKIGVYVDDINVIGKTANGYAGVFYYKLNDTLLNYNSLPIDTICNIVQDEITQRFYVNGKMADSSQTSLFEISFNNFTINDLLPLKCIQNFESSTPTGFNMAMPMSLSFTSQSDSNIYYIPELYNIRIDTIKTGGIPGKILGTWGCYVGIKQRESELLSIQAFPNPANEQLNIILSHLADGEEYLFEIFDLQGRKHYQRWVKPKEKFQINTSNFPKGVLILKLNGKQITRTKKVINK